MGSHAEGMKRLTPASLAALARGICSSNSSVPEMQQMSMSMSEREETSVACGESRVKAQVETPREDNFLLAGFETEVGRVKEMMLLGVMWDGCERKPLTIDEPVWLVAPTMPMVGAIADVFTQSCVVLVFPVCCVFFKGFPLLIPSSGHGRTAT